MVMDNPSKGGSSLSQAFMQNNPAQAAPGQLPTITQPQQQPLPQVQAPPPQQPAPVMGSMAPFNPFPLGDPQFNIGSFGAKEGSDIYMNRAAKRQQEFAKMYGLGGGQRQPQQQQQAPQISQAQLMARAINERAQGGG